MSRKVLIVDDEANIVISLEFLMEQAGYTVDIARTGDEALAKIADFAPDLILLDVMLPGMNGFDICQRIRQTPAWRHIKVGAKWRSPRGWRWALMPISPSPFQPKRCWPR